MSKKLINKKNRKKVDGKCHFCNNDDYCTLDVHRIVEGKDGGRYVESNCVTCCSTCHRKIHDGQIKIDRWYLSTSGYVLHYWQDGQENWK